MAWTWDPTYKNSYTLSNENLTASNTTATDFCRGTLGLSTGVRYFTVICRGSNGFIGICNANLPTTNTTSSAYQMTYCQANGYKYSGTATAYGATYVSGDIIDVCVNFITNKLTFYKNGVTQGDITGLIAGPVYPVLTGQGNTGAIFTITHTIGRIPGITNWDGVIDNKKRRVSDILNYGGRIPSGMGF